MTPLYRDAREDVRIETWAPRRTGQFGSPGGAELFVLDGTFEESSESFTRWSWLRLPHNVFAHLRAGEHGFRAWVKTGHLRKLERRARFENTRAATSHVPLATDCAHSTRPLVTAERGAAPISEVLRPQSRSAFTIGPRLRPFSVR